MASFDLRDTSLSREKHDELSNQVEMKVILPERMEFIRKTRVEEKGYSRSAKWSFEK